MGTVDRKSYKREVSVAMLIFLGSMFVWGAGWDNRTATDSAMFLAPFVFLFSAGAYGIEGMRQLSGPK